MVRFLAALGLLLGIGAAQAQPIYFGGASGGGGGGCTVSGTQFDILAVDNTGSGCHADSAATVNAGALTLGASGTLGTITLGNATSGTILFTPPTGALGSKTQTFQDVTDTFAYLGTAQTYTAAQTFTNSDLLLLGSSTGATTFTSANAGASNFTITFPAATDTVAMLAATQTFTNKTLTSPALGGTVTGSPTFSGNLTFSGATLTMSGLTSGTVAANSYIGLDVSNHLVLGSGGGGGGGNVTGTGPTTVGHVAVFNNTGATGIQDGGAFGAYAPSSAQIVTLNASNVPGPALFGGTLSFNTSTLTLSDSAISLTGTGQVFTGGLHPTAFSNGTASSGTTTIDCGNGPIQTLTNGGAFTFAMSANDGDCVVRVTNNGSAGAITFSGFSEGTNTGDALTTINTNKFDVALTRIGGNPHYLVSALQ